MPTRDQLAQLELWAARASELDAYAKHTRDDLVPELERLAVPWHYFAWRKLYREIERRNAYVRAQLSVIEAARNHAHV